MPVQALEKCVGTAKTEFRHPLKVAQPERTLQILLFGASASVADAEEAQKLIGHCIFIESVFRRNQFRWTYKRDIAVFR